MESEQESLREMIQDLYESHRDFKRKFDEYMSVKKPGVEPVYVMNARDKFWESLIFLFTTRLEPLRQDFLNDRQANVGRVIEFLLIDIPAFRCGYEKEWYLRRIKSVELTQTQKESLRNAALEMVRCTGYRREFHGWAKLMIQLADREFVKELEKHIFPGSKRIVQKAKHMRTLILANRVDLR